HPFELRRRRDTVSRIRPRAARAAQPGTLSLAVRHRGAPGLCRVPVADLRALDVDAGDLAALRPPLPDGGADPGGVAAPAARGANLQPGLCDGGVYGLGVARPRAPPCGAAGRVGSRAVRSRTARPDR